MTVISLIWNQKEQGFGNAGDPGSIPVSGRSPREGNSNHSSTLAWKIPWMEEPHRLQFMGLQSWTQLSDFAFAFLVSPWGCAKRRPWKVKDCASPAAGELYQECTFAVTLQAVVQGRSLMTCEAASV